MNAFMSSLFSVKYSVNHFQRISKLTVHLSLNCSIFSNIKKSIDHYKQKSFSDKPHLPGVLYRDVFVVKRCDHKSCILKFWDMNALNACVMHLNASTRFIEFSISCVLNSNNCS